MGYDYLFKIVVAGNGAVGKTALTEKFCEGKFRTQYIMTIGANFMTKSIDLPIGSRNHKVKLQIWDLAGQKRFREVTPGFMSGAHGVMYVLDLSNYFTLYGSTEEELEKNPNAAEGIYPWEKGIYETVTKKTGEVPPSLLIGNKKDVTDVLARVFDKGEKESVLNEEETIIKEIGERQWDWVKYQISHNIDYRIKEKDLKEYVNSGGRDYEYLLTSAKTGENVNEAFVDMAKKLVESIII